MTRTHALRALFLVPLVSACALHARAADSRWATLEAIHNLENPLDVKTPGPCGELGPYQFREATWRQYTQEPFVCANNRCSSDAVAIQHYEHLKRALAQRGMPATAYNIGLAWNGGLGAVLSGRATPAARDYAQRAANLAADFQNQTAALTR